MKFILVFALLMSTSAFASKKKCAEKLEAAADTLKLAEMDAETTTNYKEYVLNLYNRLKDEDRNTDSFETQKKHLCESVEETKTYWHDAHLGLAQYVDELNDAIAYKGCKKVRDQLREKVELVDRQLAESHNTLYRFTQFYNQSYASDLNCPL